ncbi:deaminase domain-containing protein [Pseudomonas poae]|uniref:deaminase domain-containing protein n=1 Tax=Pseudomonas poae TaxID=200451 RepID=UPI003BAF550B
MGRNTSARGIVNILTEKAACASCLNVAEQFKAKHPNITVNILDNQGVCYALRGRRRNGR